MSKEWWLKLFFVLSAMLIGIWIPLRLLYFTNLHYSDALVDLLTFSLIAAHYFYHWKKTTQSTESQSSRQVISLAFLSDLMIAIPFDLLAMAVTGHRPAALMLLKILILKRLSYVKELLDAFASLHPVVYRLVPVVLFMPMLVHLVSCLWISMGSGTAGPDADALTEYIKGVYWTFTTLTTVGYGDIAAKTPGQMLLACSTQVLGVGVFGFILSNVASVLSRLDAARDHHLATLDRVETYMRYNNLTPQLRTQIRSYYRYIWETHRGYDDSEVLNELPGPLRAGIALELNRSVLDQVPIFSGASQDVLEDIVMQLKPKVCVPGEKIFHHNEPGDAMYFIHTGAVEIVDSGQKVLATLNPGSFFGEMALLTNNPRTATARARSFCDLYVLSRESFQHVLHRYPSFETKLQSVIAQRLGSTKKAA